MANIKAVRITADVPFNFLDADGLREEDVAALASALMAPAAGLGHKYTEMGYVPNDRGGQTSMYRIEITGQEAVSILFLRRIALMLKNCSPHAKLHIAEARDLENREPWKHIVPRSELSGETVVRHVRH